MNGIKLEKLDSSDLLDVLHYFFEEDALRDSEFAVETRDRLRVQIYSTLYGRESKYSKSVRPSGRGSSGMSGYSSNDVKPYIPPTEFNPDAINPFGSVLDAPIG